MVFSGIGAGINELTALAVTSELAPTSQRGKYVAILVFTILPFVPRFSGHSSSLRTPAGDGLVFGVACGPSSVLS
jgi:hypothetical protein